MNQLIVRMLRKGIFWDGNDILVCRLIGIAIGIWLVCNGYHL